MITLIEITIVINVENYLSESIISNSIRLYKVASIGI
jgi:hypothetical protein